MMRQSETMRAASRLLLSHPIVCLLAVLAAGVVLGVLGPIKVVHATDVAPVEAENFDNKPTGTSVVTNTTLYQNGKALRFNNNTAIAWEDVDFTSSTSSHDVVLVATALSSTGYQHHVMRRGRRSEVNVLPSDCGVIVEPERLAVLVQGGVGYDASTGGLIVEVLSLYWRDVGGMNYLEWTEHSQHYHRRQHCELADDGMA